MVGIVGLYFDSFQFSSVEDKLASAKSGYHQYEQDNQLYNQRTVSIRDSSVYKTATSPLEYEIRRREELFYLLESIENRYIDLLQISSDSSYFEETRIYLARDSAYINQLGRDLNNEALTSYIRNKDRGLEITTQNLDKKTSDRIDKLEKEVSRNKLLKNAIVLIGLIAVFFERFIPKKNDTLPDKSPNNLTIALKPTSAVLKNPKKRRK